jgi:hypothetical protein
MFNGGRLKIIINMFNLWQCSIYWNMVDPWLNSIAYEVIVWIFEVWPCPKEALDKFQLVGNYSNFAQCGFEPNEIGCGESQIYFN